MVLGNDLLPNEKQAHYWSWYTTPFDAAGQNSVYLWTGLIHMNGLLNLEINVHIVMTLILMFLCQIVTMDMHFVVFNLEVNDFIIDIKNIVSYCRIYYFHGDANGHKIWLSFF